jgi:hypothetical protein
VIIDVAIPGLDPWQEVVRNPYIWHFAFHAIPALPELLTRGRQGPYFDYFFDVLAADPARITPDARAAYAQAYATDAALTAGFGFYRAFPQDTQDNLAGSGAATGTPVHYTRGAASRAMAAHTRVHHQQLHSTGYLNIYLNSDCSIDDLDMARAYDGLRACKASNTA